MSRLLLACIAVLLLGACAKTAPEVSSGRGLYWRYTPEQLAADGYPGSSPDGLSSAEWGLLYDDEGIPYGPKSFFDGRTRLDHPYLEVTDTYVQSRWIRITRSVCCTEALLGHYLEICDLAWKDLSLRLGYEPDRRINIYCPGSMDDYFNHTGVDFVENFVVRGPTVIIQPVDVLFRRTLAAHTAYAAIAESMIEMKTHRGAPPWLQTGLASYLAEEGFEHLSFMQEFRANRESILMTPTEVNRYLVPLHSREQGRIARYNAFLMAWYLAEDYGLDKVVELLNQLDLGLDFDDAVELAYGVETEALLALIDPTHRGEPTTTLPRR